MVYLKLDDITKRFRKPCIMDVKIGLQSYEEDAPPEKKKQALLKYPYLKSVGFQILGMRVSITVNTHIKPRIIGNVNWLKSRTKCGLSPVILILNNVYTIKYSPLA